MRGMRQLRSASSLLLWWPGLLGFGLGQVSGGAALPAQTIVAPGSPPPPRPSVADAPAAATQAETAPSRFKISGRVINSITKSPVGRAEITVSPMGVRRANQRFAGRGGGRTENAVADAEGRFAIEVPSAGGWSVTAAAHGYHTQAFEEHDGYSTAVILTEAKPEYDLTFRLAPAAVIEGYVLDEAGEAVRNAQLTVSLLPPATPENQHPRRQNRGSQKADDRGYYKFSGLLAGSYDVRVQAQPWYASSGARNSGGGEIGVTTGGAGAAGAASAPDPLDVVYPIVWYPGVTDYTAATPIMLRGGETKEADFRLLPIPGFHLRVAPETSAGGEDGRAGEGGIRNNAYLTQILTDGTESSFPAGIHMNAGGGMEFSGLAPGTYVVHRQGEYVNGGASAETVRISANSARTVDLSQASPATVVTVKIDPEADKPSLQISFRDVESGRMSFAQSAGDFGRGRPRRGAPVADGSSGPSKDAASVDRTVNLQPGKYEIVLNGINDLHLASIEATGATAMGRTVTIGGGSPTLMLHVASGRSNVTGFVNFHGKADEGAMILLVPATLGDASGLDITRRDQSNTDGSFDINDVLPGAYILVAIDHGWDVNWSDPATLRGFLMRGLPLDLKNAGDRSETIEAQAP